MLTQIGIFFRKLRLDKGEIMKEMADKLQVSSAFLSAVENGKKKMPSNWIEEIPKIYQFTNEQDYNFKKAIAETEEVIDINLKNLSSVKREFAFSLARKIDTIDEEDIEKMLQKLREKEK